jgi:ABC-type nitrate/sulfonate/bicarbonate transport system substrate-binding protein
MDMKPIIILLSGFFLLAGLPSERARAQEKTIRIGFPSIAFQELPLFAATKRGFFRTEGINVELVQIAGAPAVAALLSGDVDYITHNSRIIATAVRGGASKASSIMSRSRSITSSLYPRSSKPKSYTGGRLVFRRLAVRLTILLSSCSSFMA